MKKTNENLMLLSMLFVVGLVTENAVTAKVIETGVPLLGTTITFPGALVGYALTFLVTDVVGEIWGKKEANRIVKYGFIGQLLATTIIVITGLLPTSDAGMQASYEMVLGQNIIFVIASLTAYTISQSWDIYIFHKIREKINNHKLRWIWNNLSTMSSQLIDTVIFITISFGIGFGWLFNPEMLMPFFTMIIGEYIVKFLLAALDTPFFYYLTKKR